jgi:hypothetical protein
MIEKFYQSITKGSVLEVKKALEDDPTLANACATNIILTPLSWAALLN